MKTQSIPVVIFGCSPLSETILNQNPGFECVAYLDNNPKKIDDTYLGKPVYLPSHIKALQYRWIAIASMSIFPIVDQLIELGVPEGKVLFPGCHFTPFTLMQY